MQVTSMHGHLRCCISVLQVSLDPREPLASQEELVLLALQEILGQADLQEAQVNLAP